MGVARSDDETGNAAGVVVPPTSLVNTAILLDMLPDIVLHCVCWGSIHDQRLHLLPTDTPLCYCRLLYTHLSHLKIMPYTLKQYCHFVSRFILPYLNISPTAGIYGPVAGMCPPRRSPFFVALHYAATDPKYVHFLPHISSGSLVGVLGTSVVVCDP